MENICFKPKQHRLTQMASLTQKKCVESIKFKKILDNSLIGLLASQESNLFELDLKSEKASLCKEDEDNKQTQPRELKNRCGWRSNKLSSSFLFCFNLQIPEKQSNL